MRDRDIRHALLNKVFADHMRDSDTLVVEELGLAYGQARVDVAVVNGRLHGFEIKSDADTLQRLPGQIAAYNSVFDRVTIVVGSKHLVSAMAMIPDWWGVKFVKRGIRGAVLFENVRSPSQNKEISFLDLASLLWREEALGVLESRGIANIKSKSKAALYGIIAAKIPLNDLRGDVRHALKVRVGWRSDTRLERCVGS